MVVIIELVDFIHTNIGLVDDNNCLSEQQENIKSSMDHLINLLKKSINARRNYSFSLGFDKIVGEFGGMKTTGDAVFDLAISEQFDRVIVGKASVLKVYHRVALMKNQQQQLTETVNLQLLFEVDYENEYVFHCMKVIKENNEEFLYISDRRSHVLKIRVADLMKQQNTLVWKSQQADTTVSYINVWGLDVINGRVYTLDYGKGFKVFDCTTGLELVHGDGEHCVKDHFPSLVDGYGLHFFSETEMLISHNQCVELFEKEEDVWKSVKRSTIKLSNAYSIFYEEPSNLIYIADSGGCTVNVVRKDTLQLVAKSRTGKNRDFNRPFGMIVDKKSGLLYVCDAGAISVIIFQ